MIKNFIRCWLLPPGVVYVLAIWIAGAIRGRHFSTVKRFKRGRDKLFVLANGPSFAVDYPKYKDDVAKSDAAAMNFFAVAPLFKEIRPNLYFLADPLFFASFSDLENDRRGDQRRRMEDLCTALVEGVTWKMAMVVPDFARDSDFIGRISQNRNIDVLFYNSRHGMDWTTHLEMWLTKRQMISPPPQTVANLAVGLGVVMGYREVWLLGADTSMHTMMRVDQSTNELYLENSHFYGSKRERVVKSGVVDNPATVSSWLSSISRMFFGYERIRAFADYCGVRVVNASSFSWIDSLERAKRA